jgi:hypothetical protein
VRIRALLLHRGLSVALANLPSRYALALQTSPVYAVESLRSAALPADAAAAQRVVLDDAEDDLRISLLIQAASAGKAHLGVTTQRASTLLPPARLRIAVAGQHGKEVLDAVNGEAFFARLDPGDYTLEISVEDSGGARKTWRVGLTLESVDIH